MRIRIIWVQLYIKLLNNNELENNIKLIHTLLKELFQWLPYFPYLHYDLQMPVGGIYLVTILF